MKKLLNRVVVCLLLAASVWCGAVLADRQRLNTELIRLHVVANSDSDQDQQIKLQVRDAVLDSLQGELDSLTDVEQARAYLQENLPKLQCLVENTLDQLGFHGGAVVTLCKEAFDTRYYETFTLPAGIYQALRVTIGEGEGHNWWCVAFPTLCLPATTEGFETAAAGAGFSDTLTSTLTGEEGYEIRFFLLDTLGKVENRLFQKS